MRFLYQPIIPPRMVAMGPPSPRSESRVLSGRTEAAKAIAEYPMRNPAFQHCRLLVEKKLEEGGVVRAGTQSEFLSALGIVD